MLYFGGYLSFSSYDINFIESYKIILRFSSTNYHCDRVLFKTMMFPFK